MAARHSTIALRIAAPVVAALALVTIAVGCRPYPDYDTPPLTNDERALAANCEVDGGQFERFGFSRAAICKMPELPARDAGKTCTDGSECETGTCLAKTRSCAPLLHTMYCEPVLKKGKTLNVMCPD